MGATIDGLSTALNLKISVNKGRVEQSNFPDYPLIRRVNADASPRLRLRLSCPGRGNAGACPILNALSLEGSDER